MRKIIDNNGRLFGIISIIDVFVIAVVALLVLALSTRQGTNNPAAATDPNTPVTFQVLVTALPNYQADMIEVGDFINDKDYPTGGPLGTISKIDRLPASTPFAMPNGTIVQVETEDHCNLLVTIEGEELVSHRRHLVNRVYEIGINSTRNFQTQYTLMTGTVIDIQ